MSTSTARVKPPRPVFKRSRLGCQTCKRRRKKCPERYNEEGVCERCELGGFECEPGSSKGPLRRSATTSQGSTPESSSSPEIPSPHPRPQPPPFHQPSPLNLPSASPAQPSYSFPLPALPALPALPHSQYISNHPYFSGYTEPSNLALTQPFGPAAPNSFSTFGDLSYSAALLDIFNSLPPSMSLPGYYSPSTELGNTLLGVGRGGMGGEGWKPRPVHDLRTFILKELGEGEDPNTVEDERDLNLTATLYCDFDEEWLRVWQPRQRQLVKEVMYGTVTGSPSSRAACLAVAAGLRARLLSPNDSRREAFIKRSDSYHDQAMQMLMSAPFEVQAGALFDLMIQRTEQYGPSAGYAIQELINALIVSHPQLGPHPIPFIPGAPGHLNYILQGFFVMDVLRSLALPRRTLFDISSSASLPAFTLIGDVTIDKDKEFMKGVKPMLFLFAGRMCNLAMDEKEGLMAPAEVVARAEVLEREIIEWQPSKDQSEERSAEDELECFATQEMWRHALLINLRQVLYHLGSLHTSIRTSVDSIIAFGCASPSPSSSSSASSTPLIPDSSSYLERAVPWFIAATCATCKHDRAITRQAFGFKSPFFGVNNLPIAEMIWEATDRAGYPLEWRSVLEKGGVSMMFV
ncbi:fungal-specific transcription factor domain-domain-containing protein [Leucosporidium creatinivorum]|uniref:Fungal-specific transcription factor domain-domain-containing protein n=1 Tax=Leucosporidium creatinivorum TaxID=106004 RepID=A0A1Y2G4K8_9BASI|nr:fungal-specific transcription factor domain-domain-containing protein [Leucosporidium creatinivorum]